MSIHETNQLKTRVAAILQNHIGSYITLEALLLSISSSSRDTESVGDPVGDTLGDELLVCDSVGDPVGDTLGDALGDALGDELLLGDADGVSVSDALGEQASILKKQ